MSSIDSPLVLSEDNVLTLNLAQQAESQETGKPFKMGSPDSFVALLKTTQWLPQFYVSKLVSDALEYYAENKAEYASWKAKQASAKKAPVAKKTSKKTSK